MNSASDVSSSIPSALITNDDDVMKEIEAIPSNEIVILEQQPNEQSVNNLLDNNLVLIESADAMKDSSSNVDCNNSNYYITETLQSDIHSDEVRCRSITSNYTTYYALY